MTTKPSAHESTRARTQSTHALARHSRDGSLEQRAHDRLILALGSGNPDRLRTCVAVIRELYNADSAGLHVMPAPAMPRTSHVDVICGTLETQEDQHARIGGGLAKLCSNAHAPIVLSEQEIELTFLRHLRPRLVHVMIAPIYDEHQFVGAIWLAQVSSTLTYSRADSLVLQRVAHDLALGLKVLEREQQQASLRASLEAHCVGLGEALNAEQRRREQAEVAASEADKARIHATTLLKEGHHRVKNTLQVSCSLLSLQAHATSSEAVRAGLRQASERLQLAMQVHELLYDPARSSKQIPAADLLNLVIASLLKNSFEVGERIALHTVSDEVMMSSGECTTLMIIVNELVTNALKHAFPAGLRGSITVELKKENGGLLLRVADTGAGLSTPTEAKHFGLTLVQSLVDQLGGTFTMARSPSSAGTVVTLTIPDADRHVRLREAVEPTVQPDSRNAEVIS
ncbi:MAG TPA: histidine kinase dimerization/phosphoacceptor domain -containing protein [Steroidobacteraceae bacterium]|nr:histidine kinase dimerization/phosphoacceptor domain -containing protein [Steroidobacteraceae bacterium]